MLVPSSMCDGYVCHTLCKCSHAPLPLGTARRLAAEEVASDNGGDNDGGEGGEGGGEGGGGQGSSVNNETATLCEGRRGTQLQV